MDKFKAFLKQIQTQENKFLIEAIETAYNDVFETYEDEIEGGLADDKKPEEFDIKQILKGIEIEYEHSKDPKIALEIAMDHLTENPKYYDYLEEMENKMEDASKEEVKPELSTTYNV